MKRRSILLVILLPALAALGGGKYSGSGEPRFALRLEQQQPLVAVQSDVPPAQDEPLPTAPEPLRRGADGPAIRAVENRLAYLGYLVGEVDGVFDSSLRHGLIAFQKVHGLERSGVGDTATMQALGDAVRPEPRYELPADHLEVDIEKQVVFVVRNGTVDRILPASTGSNRLFTNQGWTRRAITPNGMFSVSRKIDGLRVAPLGELYKPSYFNGGIAFHGAGSVPAYPASHGCVRLPMQFADWFFDHAAPVGQVVYVHSGPTGDNPLPAIAPLLPKPPVPLLPAPLL